MFKTFKKYQYLLYELVKKDIKLKYRNSYLGVIWTLLEPLLTMLVLVAVFSRLLGKTTTDYAVYVLSGRLIYSFFSNGTKAGLKSVRSHAAMIKKVYVPKYMYTLSCVSSGYIMFLISLIVLVAVALVRGVYPNVYTLLAVIPLATVYVMTLGLGLILATLDVFFRDFEYLWGIALMLIMYMSGIFYEVADVASEKTIWLFKLNPLYAVIENFRNAVFGVAPNMEATWFSLGFSGVVLLIGLFVFYRKQDDFILHL
ncbi:MAG: ABC transporter permease [Lachnospiraceae bacterium]|nr:ABC transporter permease [Lachnospiraceae bacterium]